MKSFYERHRERQHKMIVLEENIKEIPFKMRISRLGIVEYMDTLDHRKVPCVNVYGYTLSGKFIVAFMVGCLATYASRELSADDCITVQTWTRVSGRKDFIDIMVLDYKTKDD